MSAPDPAGPRPGDRFVSRRGIGPDLRHYAVVRVTAVRRRHGISTVYYSGDGVGLCATDLEAFAAEVRDPAGPDGDPDNPPVREPRSNTMTTRVTVTEEIGDQHRTVTTDRAEVIYAIGAWFPDAPADVFAALDDLDRALRRHEPTDGPAAYLGVRIERAPS